jgi:Virus neck protein
MLNPYLSSNTTGYAPSQDLYESLMIENIQISGQNYYYIPRILSSATDQIFGEDSLSSFEKCAQIEMYLSDFSGWGGEQEMISKFGFEVRNTATLTISRKRFQEEIYPITPDNRAESLKVRPCEGDLIYAPFSGSMFEIKFVDDENPIFYQLNKKHVWALRCELVQLNNERFNTGVPEIDAFGINLNRLNSTTIQENGDGIMLENGGSLIDEDFTVGTSYTEEVNYGDNDIIKKEFMDIMNFSADNPFSEKF